MNQQDKIDYRHWAASQKSLEPFFAPEWLDITCGVKHWGVNLVKNTQGDIVVAMPFLHKQKWGLSFYLPPPMSPGNGPWIAPVSNAKSTEAQAKHWRLMQDLFSHLPSNGLSIYHWDPLAGDVLSALWSGFSVQTRYTFMLGTDCMTTDELWSGLRDKVRNHIRQAEQTHKVVINPAVDDLIGCYTATFERKNMPFAGSVGTLTKLLNKGSTFGWFKSWTCENVNGNAVAGLTLLIGSTRAWIMFQGTRATEGSRGALSLLVWEAIQYCQERKLLLDFEGSVLEPVARNAANFGAQPVPYPRIFKDNIWFKIWKTIQGSKSS
jgi:hypothetical protein